MLVWQATPKILDAIMFRAVYILKIVENYVNFFIICESWVKINLKIKNTLVKHNKIDSRD